jgi:peptidoglycan/xylan/chitin deacetylase (PgdA/CDA1 family)
VLALALSAAAFSTDALAQTRSVAITVDDLPYAGATPAEAGAVNGALLQAFQKHHIPVTGFVIEQRSESLGGSIGTNILKDWVARGFNLGNHTYSHRDGNTLTVAQIEDEIVRGEATIGPLMKGAHKKLTAFRFPMNFTGNTQEKHDAIAAFLAERGYRLATCTIDTSDYLFNSAYQKMLAAGDTAPAEKLRAEYLAYTRTEIDYYAALDKQVFGYEPPEVMLLHDNRLNADMIDQILRIFEEKQYKFVTLDVAQSDAAYRTPETFITAYGMMWGYRWAKVRNVKVIGSLETEPPLWILDYGKPAAKAAP